MGIIINFLSSIFNMTIRTYRDGQLLDIIGSHYVPDLVTPYLDRILSVNSSVAQVGTRMLHSYGIIRTDDGIAYIIGPAVRMKPDDIERKEIALELKIAPEERQDLYRHLDTLPIIPLNKFAEILCMANSVLNGSEVQPENVLLGYWPEETAIDEASNDSSSLSEYNYETEKHLMALVTRGDVHTLKKYMMQTTFRQDYNIANDSIRNVRNIMIVSTTLATRAAIGGGLAPTKAFDLSDMYIRTVETISSPQEIYKVMVRMLLDFTDRVGACTTPETASPAIASCLRYIRRNVSQPITINDVAKYVNMSCGYLSTLFRKEVGMTFSDYVSFSRIEESKRLVDCKMKLDT